MSETTCTAKHTKYQPAAKNPIVCPECGATSQSDGKGCYVDMSADGGESCELLHVEDEIRCYACDWGASGKAYAQAAAKKKNLVTCPTCKGSGHIQGATKP